ncbi:MAG: phosphate-binding protein [Planctomycetota bacterium]|nr:MAG: phosphate-binding protein [Planctomycetota bacterium]
MRYEALCLATALLAVPMADTASAQVAKAAQKEAKKVSMVDKAIGKYTKVTGVSGSLNSVGSDTLNNLMTLWAESYQKIYPNVKIQIEGKGSSTAPPALIEGTSQLGPMSRQMKSKEEDKFEKAFGYKPTKIPVAIDALAVFVHKDNPIEKLTLQQVDAMFSKGRKGGLAKAITNWGGAGLSGQWASKPIRLYGRNSASGTYSYFKKQALFKGDYLNTVKEQPGSSAVVSSIASDPFAIGYSGIGYKTSGVKTVPLAKMAGERYYSTDPKDVYSGKYPLARFLYIYVNKAPGKDLDPLTQQYLRFILSREGQTIVEKDGYLPLTKRIQVQSLKKLGL